MPGPVICFYLFPSRVEKKSGASSPDAPPMMLHRRAAQLALQSYSHTVRSKEKTLNLARTTHGRIGWKISFFLLLVKET
jgi:hypothetical protein